MNFAKRAAELSEEIAAHRHYLHQHAELSFQEKETTAYLVEQLTKLGIPVQSFEDYTGCIATIQGSQPGKTVLLRADIDALPIQENSGVEFESTHPGVMHACGHDCHTAMLLGAAHMLWEQREQLKGTVKLLFQAAEEVFVGSHYYWDKGYLSDVDAAMGMHVWPTVDSGKLCIQDGPLMASCDNFKITDLYPLWSGSPGFHRSGNWQRGLLLPDGEDPLLSVCLFGVPGRGIGMCLPRPQ